MKFSLSVKTLRAGFACGEPEDNLKKTKQPTSKRLEKFSKATYLQQLKAKYPSSANRRFSNSTITMSLQSATRFSKGDLSMKTASKRTLTSLAVFKRQNLTKRREF